jgi:hypothetical protein
VPGGQIWPVDYGALTNAKRAKCKGTAEWTQINILCILSQTDTTALLILTDNTNETASIH